MREVRYGMSMGRGGRVLPCNPTRSGSGNQDTDVSEAVVPTTPRMSEHRFLLLSSEF